MSIYSRIEIYIVVYSVNELLYSSKNEWITVKLYNMVDSQKYNFE